ncbi:hypothetical protein [[Ruminococcus] torques]|jgi:hypothetical protein|uniref:hypothetical protein n=2 Tax=Mediterraneibacter TaxID=2316020 RepID=UPI0006C4826B|nr:hypothetical protein [[Ruminococcus] torques]CUQ68983.1 Uncharacterised protein [[Ruminococcus] torques]
MELVTGRAGSPHITSQQDRQKHQGIWGDGAYILATGNQLEPQVQSSNKILIKDGALMFQGAIFSVKVGTTDEITINNGNQGMQRKDLVVARYTYDSAQQKESAEWIVIQGEPAARNPVAPSSTSGDIQEGDTTVDCPFMIVNLDGINVTGVDIIPEVAPDIPTLNAALSNKINAYDMSIGAGKILTGETFGGKPVYMRLVDIGVLPNNTSKTINTGITNAYYFWIDPTYSMVISGGAAYPLPYVDPNNVANSIAARIIANGQQVVITTHSNWSTYAGFVAVRYTKQ